MGDDHAVVGATIAASTSVTQAWADNGGLNFGAVEQIAIDVIAHDVTDKLVERGVPLCPGGPTRHPVELTATLDLDGVQSVPWAVRGPDGALYDVNVVPHLGGKEAAIVGDEIYLADTGTREGNLARAAEVIIEHRALQDKRRAV